MQLHQELALQWLAKYRQKEVPASIPALRQFVEEAWSEVLHPSEPLELDGAWYIDLICEWLTVITVSNAVGVGRSDIADLLLRPYGLTSETTPAWLLEIKRLSINISPRCSKSTIVTVCWPCWEWLVMRWITYMCLSYDQGLASDHNDDRRSIIRSDWYQKLSGGMALSNSKNRITEFKNDAQGQMVARGLNAGVTGGGGLRIIFDDGNDPNKVESLPLRTKAAKSFRDYSVTRANNPQQIYVVNVQQRTHAEDISGIIESDPDWYRVVIPMEAEKYEVLDFPLSGQSVIREPGHLMHPERFPPSVISTLKRNSLLWAGRYQQRPMTAGGGMFKIGNWRLYVDLPACDRTILSCDATFKKSDGSDFVVIGAIAQKCNVRSFTGTDGKLIQEHDYYLPGLWRAKAGITDTQNGLREMAAKYPEAITKLIEEAANGHAIIEQMSSSMHGITGYKPGSESKLSRAGAIQPIQDAPRHSILLPIADWAKAAVISMGRDSITLAEWWALHPPAHKSTAEHAPVDDWVKNFIDELALFPNGANDDQVDMLSQGINWLEASAIVPNFGVTEASWGY